MTDLCVSTLQRTLPVIVGQQVSANPDRIAAICGETSLSYRSLDERAAHLCGWLSGAGIGSGSVVAIVLPRSIDLIAAVLGVAKAGAAYVCVDPATPALRLAQAVRCTSASAIVTADARPPGGLSAALPAYPGPGRVPGDRQRTAGRPAGAADTALIIYTSGSTGEPRAVALEHRQLVPVVMASEVDIRPGDRILLLASVAFDASAFEIWAALARGATLVVAAGPADIPDLVGRHQVTGMLISSALFATFVDVAMAHTDLSSLRWVYVGGEELSPRHAARFAGSARGCALYNCYGPTETSVFATRHRVGDAADLDRVPIGSPALGKRVYLLDDQLELAPSGEVYIGGAGVARGYHGAPAATAQRFVPDPDGQPGGRMFRTGDLAAARPDGSLDFLGRVDRQVKVLGHRVDPGEVEAALRASPAVGQAVVSPVARHTGGTALCAYLVLSATPGASVVAVREWLGERLPPYLVPSRFVVVDALPLTPNGKVDHAALPAPWHDRAIADTPYVPPRGAAERTICELWGDVLGVASVGVDDNFFELGGDSLSSVELLARVGGALGVELTVRDLIMNQTVAELAGLAGQRLGAAGRGPLAEKPA